MARSAGGAETSATEFMLARSASRRRARPQSTCRLRRSSRLYASVAEAMAHDVQFASCENVRRWPAPAPESRGGIAGGTQTATSVGPLPRSARHRTGRGIPSDDQPCPSSVVWRQASSGAMRRASPTAVGLRAGEPHPRAHRTTAARRTQQTHPLTSTVRHDTSQLRPASSPLHP